MTVYGQGFEGEMTAILILLTAMRGSMAGRGKMSKKASVNGVV